MIDALNKQKDKWQELLEIREVAEAYALVGDAMSEFGYTVEDVLNDTPGAFEAFSKAYIEALSGSNAGNDKFLEGLQKTLETGSANLNQFADDMPGIMSKMSSAVENSGLKSSIENTLGHLFDDAKGKIPEDAKEIGKDISEGLAVGIRDYLPVAKNAGDELGLSVAGTDGDGECGSIAKAAGTDCPSEKTEQIGTDLGLGLANGLTKGEGHDAAVKGGEQLANDVIDKFKEIFENADFNTILTSLQTALSSEGGLASLISSLDTLTLSNLVAQFTALQGAISSAAGAIDGSGGGTGSESLSLSSDMIQKDVSGGGSTGGSGLTSALQSHIDMATGEEGIPKEIALFAGNGEGEAGTDSLVSSIEAVEQELLGEKKDPKNDDPENLIGATKVEVDTAKTLVDDEILKFEELRLKLESIKSLLSEIISMMSQVTEGGGSFSSAGFPHNYTGTAYANGKWNAGSKGTNGKSLVGELGSEIIVHSNGTYETVGEHGAEFKNIKPSDIVFNHKQSEALLKYGHINSRGKAYAEGNLPQGFSLLSEDQLGRFNLFNKADIPTMSGINTAFERQTKDLTATIKAVTNSSTINNAPIVNITGDNHFDCAGLQPEQVSKAVNDAFMGMANRTYQKTMSR